MKPILLAILLSLPLTAGDPWTRTQIALEGTFQAALLCDWRQTSDFHRTWEPYRTPEGGWVYPIGTTEANPLLGRHPSQATINEMCLASSIGHLLISEVLPGRWRTVWQGVSLAGEVGVAFPKQVKATLKMEF